MSKKKATTQTPFLSPENYIRKNAKNLPLGECFITKDWKERKLCNIIITRKHVTGNVTSCMYLVDLACLGVKDTMFQFNVPFGEVQKIMEKHDDEGARFIKVSYELVHNIIFAAIEFAEEYGFKPYKDFTSITSHFLENDTDEIPLIEIACGGQDGNPLYVNSGFDSPERVKGILAQLEKTAGEGNYHFLMNVDNEENIYNDDDDDDDDEDEEVNEEYCKLLADIKKLDKEEQRRMFVDLVKKPENQDQIPQQEETMRLIILTHLLSFDLVTPEAIDEQLEILDNTFENDFVEIDELPNSLFTDVRDMDGETISQLFDETMDAIDDNKKPKKAIKSFRNQVGDVPVADFVELYYLYRFRKRWRFKRRLKKYHQKHPHYFMIQYYYYTYLITKNNNVFSEELDSLLSKKKNPITAFEAEFYLLFYTFRLVYQKNTNLAVILAYEEFINDLDFFPEETFARITSLIETIKIQAILEKIEGK